jgi:predicted esterase
MANLRTPILLTHGAADTTVPFKYALEAEKQLAKSNPFVTFKAYTTGHELTDAHLQDLKSFILRRLPRI